VKGAAGGEIAQKSPKTPPTLAFLQFLLRKKLVQTKKVAVKTTKISRFHRQNGKSAPN